MRPKIKRICSNQTEVTIGNRTYFFSYDTCVGFRDTRGTYVSENVWSATTGKHLNHWERDHNKRLSPRDLEFALSA